MAGHPETIGGYKIVRELGRGAMGTVYLAYQDSLGRDLAIKVMAPEFGRDEEFVERFRREGRIAAKLRHPNIVQVYDFCDRDGVYFIAMEYLGSRTLKGYVKDLGRVPCDDAVRLCCQLLAALDHAHSQGIVHRDLKPANVMVTDQGDAALTDFSIAHMKSASKLTQTGSVLGTPEYMAPEQFEGKADHRSDLYSTGIILYEMLTGFSPFHAETIAEVMKKQLFVAPDPPAVVDFTIPEALSSVVVRCLAKEPADRYQTAREMATALQQALKSSPTAAASSLPPAHQVVPPPPVVTSHAPTPPVKPHPGSGEGRSCAACKQTMGGERFCPHCGQDSRLPVKTRSPETLRQERPVPPKLDLRPGEVSLAPPLAEKPPEKPALVLPEPPPPSASPSASTARPQRPGGILQFVEDEGTLILGSAGIACALMLGYASATREHMWVGFSGGLGLLFLIPACLVLAVFLLVRRAGFWPIFSCIAIACGCGSVLFLLFHYLASLQE